MKNFILKRKINMKKSIYVLISSLLFLSACQTTKHTLPVVQGMIYDGDNEAVSDVEIYINDKKNALSDIYGHFTLSAMELEKQYELTAKKNGYEEKSFSFTYTNPSQVIYLRMYSNAELINLAESMVEQKKYADAETYLTRAELAGGNYLSVNYLRAVICVLKTDYDNALKIATDILDAGYIDSYIYLLLADIYKDGYSDIENEQLYLKKALTLSYDPAIQKRIIKQ